MRQATWLNLRDGAISALGVSIALGWAYLVARDVAVYLVAVPVAAVGVGVAVVVARRKGAVFLGGSLGVAVYFVIFVVWFDQYFAGGFN